MSPRLLALRVSSLSILLFVAPSLFAVPGCAGKAAKLIFGGHAHELRKRPPGTPPDSPDHPPILLLAFDGVDRAILYDMLRGGELPALAALLGGANGRFDHAYFSDSLLSTLPSSTMAAWVTAFTGVGPAHHGIAGNEFFIREQRQFAAPAPVTFSDSKPVLAIYTDEYLNKLRCAPSVYERLREADPNVLVWVAMHHFYPGVDRLLVTKPSIVADAFQAAVEEELLKVLSQKESRAVYEKLDTHVMDVVLNALEEGPVPDVLTVYLSGTDLYAHIANEGPDEARRNYLREVVDPQMARLAKRLGERHALADRYIVVTSDHGHTQVVHDDVHALTTDGEKGPPAILGKAGFRVRPFQLEVSKDHDFQAVLAYGGAMAYVYLADRSRCAPKGSVCDWRLPPRHEEDVLSVAEAFHRNNSDGSLVPQMKGTLDLILTRRPRPYAEDDLPFEVYVGHGRTMPVDDYLKAHPHPTYVDVSARLRDLAVGPHGERAGDILLLAHNGDRDRPEERYYFAARYRSWHGSPSKKDSEIPLVVANRAASLASIEKVVRQALGEQQQHQQAITNLILLLRRLPRTR